MGLTKICTRLAQYFVSFKKLLRDTVGTFLLRQWKQTEKGDIVSIEESMLPEVFRIQEEGFKNGNKEKIAIYSKKMKKIFYVIMSQDKVVGYCIYYLKSALSLKGFEKISVICAIATDSNYRGRGFAERLLKKSIEEMKLNGISSILLYVNVHNQPAIRLYEKIGFQKTDEVNNICGQDEKCYEMKLKLI
ncbi:MAG: GNAT family N-acetyltransferase [Methanosarcina sp.]